MTRSTWNLVSILGLGLFLVALPPLALATTEGHTPGTFALSPNGAATYTIPIWSPPGPRGIQPNISLAYNSQSGNGPIGVGWSIGGLGAIYRCNLTYAQDPTPAAVQLATSDGYCINGNRLRLTSGTYGTAGSTYQTEVADFSNVTANGTAGNGPAYFTVQARNGLTYQYGYVDANGNGANSQVLASGTTTANYWLLSKVIDRAGNNYVINYTLLTGTAVPANILWTPTSSGSSSYVYQMTFNYNTGGNVPQSSLYAYVAGTAITNTNLLTSISIATSGTVVKDYFLSYTTSPTTGRDELQTIKECADSAQSNCLLPTSVTYQSGTAGVSSSATTAISTTSGGAIATGDFNGDGFLDLVYASGGMVYVAFGSATGYGTPVSTGISVANLGPVGDIAGNGFDEILGNVGGTWYRYYVRFGTFHSATTGVPWPGSAAGTFTNLVDTNGDGLPDIVTTTLSGTSYNVINTTIRLNTSSGITVSFASSASSAFTYTACSGCVILYFAPDGLTKGPLRSWDFNGDGRQDLMFGYAQNILGTEVYYFYQLLGNGTTFTSSLVASATGTSYSAYAVNWNNDRCTDFVLNATVYVSGCAGTPPSSFSVGATILAALDWDGDGRTDLLVQNGSTIGVYQSTGNGISTLQSTSVPYSSSCSYFVIDPNADGLDDLGCEGTSGSYAISYYLHNGAGTPPDLVSKIIDGYGNSVSPSYLSLTNALAIGANCGSSIAYPDQQYCGPLYVATQATYSDSSSSSGATYNQTFQYVDAVHNLQGRGFEGFQYIVITDSRDGSSLSTSYGQQFPYTGTTNYVKRRTTSGTDYIVSDTWADTVLDSTSYNQRYFPYISAALRTDYEVGGIKSGQAIRSTTTGYTFDSYGNATATTTTITDTDSTSPASPYNGDSWTTTVTNTPDVDTAHWCLNLFTQTQVAYTATIGSGVTRTQTFTPDTTNCRYTQIVTEPTANSGLYKVTENLGYDSFGNVNSDSLVGANMPNSPATRTTTRNWGTTGQFINTQTDPASATTTWTYTSNQALTFGVPDSVKDPNNLTTSWTYDPFGRKIKEVRPDSTSTTWAWTACTSNCGWSNSVYQIAQTAYQTNGSTVIRTDTTSYDPIDRVTQTVGPTVTGTNAIVQRLYNSLGLLTQQSFPYLSGGTVYQQTMSYDRVNRVSSVSRPISSSNSTLQSTSYAYEGRTTIVTDPNSNTKTLVNDVNGWLRQTTDGVGYKITRAFDSAGSLTGVTDSVGNTLLSGVTYNYGLKPYLVAATDADLGAWTYTVDSLGEQIGWKDAKSQSFSETYDALSRPLTRTEPDLFTQWTWGSAPASYNVGQLISECTGTGTACTSSGYAESRTFDSTGRLSTRSITLGGDPGNNTGGVFLFTYGYSTTTGFLNTLTYPISTSSFALTLQYGYSYGLLQTVTDTSDSVGTCGTTCTLWTANAVNPFGEVTQETLGNNVVINRTYDAVTSWLTAAQAGVGGGSTLLNQSYLQDKDGNVTQRQNNNLGLTESLFYDADNRLTCASLTGSCSTPTVVYDGGAAGPGNITTLTGAGTYTYPTPGHALPHAVSSITGSLNGITNPVFSYDANGNMTARASSSANITWSSYNYPTQISGSDATGTETVQFNYGPDRQRWAQVYNGTGYSTETTYYIGQLIDQVVSSGVTNYRHYVYAGNEPVAVYSRTSTGTNTMSYMLEDHQGSISTIASNSGAVDVNESFTPFGNRRNPTTWSGTPTTADLNTIASLSRQGYTFQTALGQTMGLNHMNGRVQDAVTGRLLSADPYVPDPASAQSYNRFSYVSNNPLSFTDPSGFLQQCVNVSYSLPGDNEVGEDGLVNIIIGYSVSYQTCFDIADVQPIVVPALPAVPNTAPSQQNAPPSTSKPQSAPNPIVGFFCAKPAENAVQRGNDMASNVGTAAEAASPLVSLGAAAAGASRAAGPAGQLASTFGQLADQALSALGQAGRFSAQLGLAIDFLTGDGASFIYDSADYFVYSRLAAIGAAGVVETGGESAAVAATTMAAYATLGGSRGVVQSQLCGQ